MDDTISRQYAIDALCKMRCGCVLSSCPLTLDEDGTEECADVRMLMELPSAQPERKKGKWTATKEWGGRNYSCSCCKFSFIVDTCMLEPMWNFCPNCGAEMKGEEDERIENS